MFTQQAVRNKAILMKPLLTGKICYVKWITNDGRIRQANVKLWNKKGITYFPTVMDNPCAHLPEYVTCIDIKKQSLNGDTRGWVNIACGKIIEVKAKGILWHLFNI